MLVFVAVWFALFGPAAAAQEARNKSWDYPPFGATDVALYQAFQQSCSKFMAWPKGRQLHPNKVFGTAGQWAAICTDGLKQQPNALENFLNTRLSKVQLSHKPGGRDDNTNYSIKFTGYYKPVLEGSKRRHGPYQTPLVAKPKDLVICNGKTGQRLPNGSCRNPYPTRAQIEQNIHNYQVLVWLKDPVSAFFLHVQGSGTIELDDGGTMHVGFAAKNGHPYVAIGKTLRDRGLIKAPVTADKIRDYLAAHPDQVDEVTHSNPSFIFFHVTKEEAPGAMGVKLTGGRSLAVDRDYIPLGVPVFVKTTNTYDDSRWHRLMFAQDVGSAIQGPVRGDIYFGHGPLAGQRAGRQNASGQLWVMVPRENVGMQSVVAEVEAPPAPAAPTSTLVIGPGPVAPEAASPSLITLEAVAELPQPVLPAAEQPSSTNLPFGDADSAAALMGTSP
ncbi:MAG: MltA domain-containing protein [Alphaproteobacteria bacterium]|nr:MltA domain-containing protein [Alphaproteobacteria bacterium]